MYACREGMSKMKIRERSELTLWILMNYFALVLMFWCWVENQRGQQNVIWTPGPIPYILVFSPSIVYTLLGGGGWGGGVNQPPPWIRPCPPGSVSQQSVNSDTHTHTTSKSQPWRVTIEVEGGGGGLGLPFPLLFTFWGWPPPPPAFRKTGSTNVF